MLFRSFNWKMLEEINRVLTDHIAGHLFCPTYAAIRNLRDEGITRNVFHSGDVMYDAALTFGKVAEEQSAIMSTLRLNRRSFCDIGKAENFIKIMQEKEKFRDVLSSRGDGFLITIGGENGEETLKDCNLITCDYKVNGEFVGKLGVTH